MQLVYHKNYCSLAEIFFTLFKTMTNKTECLNRGLPSNFWWLRSANYMKCTEECVTCTMKHILVQKIFTNWPNMCLLLRAQLKQRIHGVETHWSSGKKVMGAAFSKENNADSLLAHERTYLYWFVLKRCNCK